MDVRNPMGLMDVHISEPVTLEKNIEDDYIATQVALESWFTVNINLFKYHKVKSLTKKYMSCSENSGFWLI